MSLRIGVSLIECLASLVLLSAGLSGAAATMLTAQRLERIALRYHAATRLAGGAVERFTAMSCPIRDSVWHRVSADEIDERWAIIVRDSVASLEGAVVVDRRHQSSRISVVARRRCVP